MSVFKIMGVYNNEEQKILYSESKIQPYENDEFF